MCANQTGYSPIPAQTLRRLPTYYTFLKMLEKSGVERVSSAAIARDLRLGEVQVRKDMAMVSEAGGRPRTGFLVSDLISCIQGYLGYDKIDEAILVGVGNLGRALLSYSGFSESGVDIVAAFDANSQVAGSKLFGKQILLMETLPDLCRRMGIRIGIIAVPAEQAQAVCDRMIAAGILAIWNFAPVHLDVPEGILVQHENMAASLAMLSRFLEEKLSEDRRKES